METMNHTPPLSPEGATGYRALVVDDERPLAAVVASYLEREHFEVAVAYNGVDALTLAREIDPDVVVLDLGLPGMDGIEVCRELRTFSDAYVVMLTARSAELDTIIGLSVGADDYVTKPFSPRELVARIRAMLRRPRQGTGVRDTVTRAGRDRGSATGVRGAEDRRGGPGGVPRRAAGDVDPHRVRCAGGLVVATGYGIQSAPVDRGRVGRSWVGNEHLVDVHVGHLRRKLGDDPAAPRYVTTVRGIGYRMGTGQ